MNEQLILSRYKLHFAFGGLVFITLAAINHNFGIPHVSSWNVRIFYGFLQVFFLVSSLVVTHRLLSPVLKNRRLIVASITICLGNLLGVFSDFLLLLVLNFIHLVEFPKFPDLFSTGQYLAFEYFKDLRFSVLFWILAELLNNYAGRLSKIIKVEFSNGESSSYLEKVPFLKQVPASKRNELYAIEAQENYISLIFKDDSRTLFYRFKNAISEMPDGVGMQVHRSFWVAYKAIDMHQDSKTLKLKNGKEIPISRSFSREVRDKLNTSSGKSYTKG